MKDGVITFKNPSDLAIPKEIVRAKPIAILLNVMSTTIFHNPFNFCLLMLASIGSSTK